MPAVLGVGDILAVGDLALRLYKDVYKVSRAAPMEIKELGKELSVLSTSLQVLLDEAKNPESILVRSGESRVNMVNEMIGNTKETLTKLEGYAKKHELDASAINSLRARISYHCGVINMLLTSIGNSSLERLQCESQSIARNTDEMLSLLKTLIVDRSQGSGLRPAALIPSPIISTSEADMVKDELSLEFLKNVEDHDQCSWLETSIDIWLERGRYWLSKAKFNIAKLKLLKRQVRDLHKCDRTYKTIVTALLKASWIVMGVVRDHPMRTYITSGHRQLSITRLSNNITAELKILRSLNFNPLLSLADVKDFEIAMEGLDSEPWTLLESCFQFLPHRKGTEILPSFQCFAEIRINESARRSELARLSDLPRPILPACLVRLDEPSSGLGMQLTILGPRAFELGLVAESSVLEVCLRSSSRAEQEIATAVTCYIWSEKTRCVPITLDVRSPLNDISPVVKTVLLRLRDSDEKILSPLRSFMKSRLEQMNRLLMQELEEYLFENLAEAPAHARAIVFPTTEGTVHPSHRTHDVCLTEIVARAIVLDDCAQDKRNFEGSFHYPARIRNLNPGHKDRIRSFFQGIFRMIRECRWWTQVELFAAEDGHSLSDEELTNSVLECMGNWKCANLDAGWLIDSVSRSRAWGDEIMEIRTAETVEEAEQWAAGCQTS